MLGTGPWIGPLTLLLELHSALFSVVPAEVREPAVRSALAIGRHPEQFVVLVL